jgi:hypothetical protein
VASISDLAGQLRAAIDQLQPAEITRCAEQLRAETVPLLNQLAQESSRWQIAEAAALVATAPDELEQAAALYRQAITAIQTFMTEHGMTETAASIPEQAPSRTPPARQKSPSPANTTARDVDSALIDETQRLGHKISPEKVVRIGRDHSSKIVWLEDKETPEGAREAGVRHLLSPKRIYEFAEAGVAESDIVDLVFQATTQGTPIGIAGRDRVVFATTYQGREIRVAVTVSANGFIIGGNPISLTGKLKPLP